MPLKKVQSASRNYLKGYLGIKIGEDLKVFDDLLQRIPYVYDVPLKIVVDSIEFLEGIGFSKQQIKTGFPIVFYCTRLSWKISCQGWRMPWATTGQRGRTLSAC